MDWTTVKEFTPIVIDICPFAEPITAKFKSYSPEENKIYYYEYGFVGPKLQWDIKGVNWAWVDDCSTSKVLNSFDLQQKDKN